jgi:UDP-N-acetylglucosamine--N-acetylmuramyl-(pentapeptide) pyrophosphoryl-undecaprenol N-acetylglucosamine transferase
MNTKINCFVAGKSGGHIIPCLTIADNKKCVQNERINILFFSSNTPLDKAILSQDNRISWHIMLPLRSRAGSFFATLWYAIKSFFISFFYLCKHRPEEIITTGGIVAIPPCIAGFILRIPITLYSLDAVPGKAIQLLAPLATSVITPFASSQSYFPAHKFSIKPYPVKYKNIPIPDQTTALHTLGFSAHKRTIVILGGSQGSLFLNNFMKTFIQSSFFDPKTMQIIHQTGGADSTDWQNIYQEKNISAYVFSYMPNLENIYSAADLIICRAGAGTLFEVHFFNKPCIIIPLEAQTTTHQVDNARAMTREYPELFSAISQGEIEKDPAVLYTKITNALYQKGHS